MPKPDQIPPCPSPIRQATDQHVSRRYQIELVTPMFGGGVIAGRVDPDQPVRPTTVRGQLQFWWRATVGAQYDKVAALRDAQSRIWGSTHQASSVQVVVNSFEVRNVSPCAEYEQDRKRRGVYRSMPTWQGPFAGTSLSYALFPFQGKLAQGRKEIEVSPAECIVEMTAELTLRAPKSAWGDLETALWAWANFGGLGARTRRGCGSIRIKQLDSGGNARSLMPRDRAELKQRCRALVASNRPARQWPTLAADVLVGQEQGDAIQAWDKAIDALQRFRQGPGVGRNPGTQPNRPGRSRFPEPDTLRRIAGSHSSDHAPDPEKPLAFPRAELGLPIVFHFKDKDDPPDTQLIPARQADGEQADRMASPLILKAVALDNKRFVPVIVRLKTPELAGVDLVAKDTRVQQGWEKMRDQVSVRAPELATDPDCPLAGSENGSALEAFLNFAITKHQFERV